MDSDEYNVLMIVLVNFVNRKENSLTKMDFQKLHFQVDGRERVDCMQLGLQGEGLLVLLLML